jgi:hypothetical protein
MMVDATTAVQLLKFKCKDATIVMTVATGGLSLQRVGARRDDNNRAIGMVNL